MSFQQKLQQKLDFKLSPQQLQLMSFLQIPNILFESKLKEEVEKNIALEMDENEEDNRGESKHDEEVVPQIYGGGEGFGFQKIEGSMDQENNPIENMKEEESLFGMLSKQLGGLKLDKIERKVAVSVIGSINEDGFLTRTSEAIGDELLFKSGVEVGIEVIEGVIEKIQTLEPIGVGARNLQECLRIQMKAIEQYGKDGGWVGRGLEIIDHCYDDFIHKHFGVIQKRLKMTEEELKEVVEKISKLNPKPGNAVKTNKKNEIIKPDFIVKVLENKIDIEFTKEHIPRIKVNHYYKRMYDEYSQKKDQGHETKDVVNFLKEKILQAEQLIQNIKNREQVLMTTMRFIVERQIDFFKTGNAVKLKPLILKDVAEPLKMSISTVSRIVNHKYVQTDFGIFGLKFFFFETFSNEFGDAINAREIKDLMLEIIHNEDKSNPLTDDKIKGILETKGFYVVRRTIAKYRKDLGIETTNVRKKI